VLVAVGLNHRTASVAQRELLAPRPSEAEDHLAALVALGGIDEVAIVANTWRVEIYATTRCPAAALLALREAVASRAGRPLSLYALQGTEAFRHLVRVASGVESPILGETQILSEVTAAFHRAMASGAAGIELGSALDRVLQIGRLVRADVPAARPDVSWGHCVTALAEKVLGPVAGGRVAVVGAAGQKARIAGEHLRASGADVVVLDAALADAEALARELGAEARPLDALADEVLHADVVVSSGAAVADALRPSRFAALAAQRARRIVLADLAVPRAIAPQLGDVPDVYLFDVDDMERVARAIIALDRRRESARRERLIEQEVARWSRGDAEAGLSPFVETSP
jgi:glutamyl-tRNA reductase